MTSPAARVKRVHSVLCSTRNGATHDDKAEFFSHWNPTFPKKTQKSFFSRWILQGKKETGCGRLIHEVCPQDLLLEEVRLVLSGFLWYFTCRLLHDGN